jgi:hypothetical protein
MKILSNQDYGSSSKIQNLPDATADQEPSTLKQLLTKVGSLSEKRFCRTSSGGANINLSSAPSNINGVVLNSLDRVLIANQTVPSQNGIYVWNGAGNAMTRAEDATTAAMLSGFSVYISEGGNNGSKFRHPYIITTVGTDDITIIPEPIGYHQQSIDTLTWSGALDGQVIQWNDGLNSWVPATVAGVGSAPNKIIVDVDFGANSDFIQQTVSASWISGTIALSACILPNTLDHDPEDVVLENIKVTFGNIVNATSFDIFIHAPETTWGRYKIHIIGV